MTGRRKKRRASSRKRRDDAWANAAARSRGCADKQLQGVSARGDRWIEEVARFDLASPTPFVICVDLEQRPLFAEDFVRAVVAQELRLSRLIAIVPEEMASDLCCILMKGAVSHSLFVSGRAVGQTDRLNFLVNSHAADWTFLFCDPIFAPLPNFLDIAIHYASLFTPDYMFFNLQMPSSRRLPYGIVTKAQMVLWGPLSPVIGLRANKREFSGIANDAPPDITAIGVASEGYDPHAVAEMWIQPEIRAALWRHIYAADDACIGVTPPARLVSGPTALTMVERQWYDKTLDRIRVTYRNMGFPAQFDDVDAYRRRRLDPGLLSVNALGIDLLRDAALRSALCREPNDRDLNAVASDYVAWMARIDPRVSSSASVGWSRFGVRAFVRAIARLFGAQTPQSAHSALTTRLDCSGFFDPDLYLADQPDVANSTFGARQHYIHHGMSENRRPGPYFEAKKYLQFYPEVAETGMNAMTHYLMQGATEGRIAPTWRWAMNDRGLALARRNLALGPHQRLDRRVDLSAMAAIEGAAKSRRAAGLLCCIPFMTPGNLTLRLLEQFQHNGVECFVGVQYPASVGGYQEDGGLWSKRSERVYPFFDLVTPEGVYDLLVHVIRARHIKTLLIAGASDIYPLLPRIRDCFPDLFIVDQIFNPIGHTRRLLTFVDCFDKIIVENSEMVTFFRNRNVEEKKIHEIKSGVDLAHFAPNALEIPPLKIAFSSRVKTIVGYVGRMSAEKDPLGFVTIARIITQSDPTIGILIAGGGPLLEQVRASALASLPKEQLAFLGFVDDVRSAFQSIDMLVLPSRVDGRPGAIMEANAMGVPVIATRVGGIPDMVVPGVNGFLFAPGVYTEAAEIIQVTARAPGKLAQMKQNAVRSARSTFNQDQMFLEYQLALDPTLPREGNRRT